MTILQSEPDTQADGPEADAVDETIECEYCHPPGKEPITKHGLMPAETLPNGALIHRMIHPVSCEPDGYIPCRRSPVDPPRKTYPWSGWHEKTAPAETI